MKRSLDRERPGKLQQALELVFEALYNMIEDTVGHGAAKRYLPFIATFAVFIFLSNLCGSLFFLQPPTQSVNVTFALSITAWLSYHLIGFRRHGPAYVKQFVGPGPPPVWLWPLLIPIELISHAARAFSLGLRLYGNIFGEHIALGIIAGLIPFLIPLPIMALGVFAGLIQTFIFIMLTTLYIAGAEAEEH
jgi:F-type H+-transporting ATPase subunit a